MKCMIQKVITFFLVLCLGFGMVPLHDVQAAASKEMNIYAMYLGTSDKGESVLIESKGEYLLMDLGMTSASTAIINQLKALNVKKISVYFSHMHGDHVGGSGIKGVPLTAGLSQIVSETGVTIDKLYMPDKSLVPKSPSYAARCGKFEDYIDTLGSGTAVYVKAGSSFQVGDAKVEVLGPVDTSYLNPDDYKDRVSDDGDNDDVKYTFYENNCSLITMVTCGSTKYLSVGDALEDEIAPFVKQYKSRLKADIFQLSHHGTGGGNTKELLAAVQPRYSFAQNTGLTGKNKIGEWETVTGRKNAAEYGMCTLIGNQKKTLVYQVKNDSVKMYWNVIASSNLLKGWQKLAGADGRYRTFDRYYLNSAGVPLTGVQKIDGKYFYLGKGGCMEYGNYDPKTGKNLGWNSDETGRRYYTFTPDKEYAVMTTGFKKIGSTTYYFDSQGYKVEGRGRKELKNIGKYTYVVCESGAIVKNNWATVGKDKYYSDTSGRIVKNKKVKIKSKYYYFGKDGKMVRASKGAKIITIGKDKYAVGTSGVIIMNSWKSIGKAKYYFDKSGKMVRNKIVRIASKYYYFGSSGQMVRASKGVKIITAGKDKYAVGTSGAIITGSWKNIGRDKYYFGSTGKMVKNKIVRISRKYYYFGKDGKMVRAKKGVKIIKIGKYKYAAGTSGTLLTNTQKVINGRRYSFDSKGRMKKL